MKVHPYGHNILVKPFKDEVQYGNIHLPDSAKARSNNGIVYARGRKVSTLSRGEWVVYSRRQATDIEVDGEQFVVLDERACLCVLAEKEEVMLTVYAPFGNEFVDDFILPVDTIEVLRASELNSFEKADVLVYDRLEVYADPISFGYYLGKGKQILIVGDKPIHFPHPNIHYLTDGKKIVAALKVIGEKL